MSGESESESSLSILTVLTARTLTTEGRTAMAAALKGAEKSGTAPVSLSSRVCPGDASCAAQEVLRMTSGTMVYAAIRKPQALRQPMMNLGEDFICSHFLFFGGLGGHNMPRRRA